MPRNVKEMKDKKCCGHHGCWIGVVISIILIAVGLWFTFKDTVYFGVAMLWSILVGVVVIILKQSHMHHNMGEMCKH